MKTRSVAIVLLILSSSLIRCSDDPISHGFGEVVLNFEHKLDGQALEYDVLKYTNAAGNRYEVNEIQWFLSDVVLNGQVSVGLDSDFAHYVDTDLSATHSWKPSDPIPAGKYHSITFVFGITGEKNIPLQFPNPPESDMIWPFHMGGDNGGYHYMKLNGFWIDPSGIRQPFNFHVGVGKGIDQEGNPIYYQNWFSIELEQSFEVYAGGQTDITIEMQVENWFQDPFVYDHNDYGGKIMDNQEAMSRGCSNGQQGVFRIGRIESHNQL